MDVQIEQTCGRCKKVKTAKLPFEEVQALVEAEASKQETVYELLSGITSALNAQADVAPELVVFTLEEDGTYRAHTLDNLCVAEPVEGTDDSKRRNRGCKARVTSLLTDVFEMGAVKEKAPRVRKRKPKTEVITEE